MSPRRAPAPPPTLPGFSYVDLLGSGGFADVYLFEQELPRRRVAVKVLLPERMQGSTAGFIAEANTMALLSTHPAIVTIYQAGTSVDNRPYLVMEYCPKPNLQVRYREAPFSVAEALRVGIQVAAAVETAHRVGILHRDIKPANILVTEYNRPALTDFGIATMGEADDGATGMSIPWSPPEVLIDETQGGPSADVYALGATVYSLLAGRSPFEIPGGANTSAAMIPRIERSPLPPLERADVPPSLTHVFERAMAKHPRDRYDSALAFARALQKVQIELSQSVTPIDLLDDPGALVVEPDRSDDDGTRVRGIVSIAPDASAHADAAAWGPPAAGSTPPAAPTYAAPAPELPDDDRTRARVVSVDPTGDPGARASALAQPLPGDERTVARPRTVAPTAPAAPESPEPPRNRAGLWVVLGAIAVVVVAAAIAIPVLIGALGGGQSPAPDPEPSGASYAPQNPIDDVVPQVTGLAGTTDPADPARVLFTWQNPDPRAGDAYLWGVQTAGAEASLAPVETAKVSVPADPSGRTCIEVYLKRANGTASSTPATACAG